MKASNSDNSNSLLIAIKCFSLFEFRKPIQTLIRLIMTDANGRQRNNELERMDPHANYTFNRQFFKWKIIKQDMASVSALALASASASVWGHLKEIITIVAYAMARINQSRINMVYWGLWLIANGNVICEWNSVKKWKMNLMNEPRNRYRICFTIQLFLEI